MDGWKNDGWKNGWMDEQVNGQIDKQDDRQKERQIDRRREIDKQQIEQNLITILVIVLLLSYGTEVCDAWIYKVAESKGSRKVTLELSNLAGQGSSLPLTDQECLGELLNISKPDFPISTRIQ